jgi:hypothetical protein
MPTQGFLSIQDYDAEPSSVGFWVQDLGAANYASVTQDIDEVKDAIAAVSLGVINDSGLRKVFPESFAAATDPNAQRERRWLVRMRDTTQFLDVGNTVANPGYGKIFTLTIPAAKVFTGAGSDEPALVANTDVADIVGNTAMAALVTAIEANVRSPWNHTATAPAVDVLEILLVGRNN